MTRQSAFVIFLFFFFASLFAPPYAQAEFYRYTDSHGKTVITDDIRKLPKKYRDKIEKEAAEAEAEDIREKEAEAIRKALEPASGTTLPQTAQDSASATGNEVDTGAQASGDTTDYSALFVVLKAIGVVVATLVIFYGMGLLTDLVGHKKLGTVISLILSGLVFMYLLGTHLKIVAESYRDIMGQVTKVKKGLDKKGVSDDRLLRETEGR